MSFLAALAASLLEWSAEKVALLFTAWIKKEEALISVEAAATKDKAERDNAKTPEDKSKAIADTTRDTFS